MAALFVFAELGMDGRNLWWELIALKSWSELWDAFKSGSLLSYVTRASVFEKHITCFSLQPGLEIHSVWCFEIIL